jgi:hypothetical protein
VIATCTRCSRPFETSEGEAGSPLVLCPLCPPCFQRSHLESAAAAARTAAGYVPVPVDAAREISHRYAKQIVAIIAYDTSHRRLHKTTYGQSAGDKVHAASLGDVLVVAAGYRPDSLGDAALEDFRIRTAADWAVEREHLQVIIAKLAAELAALKEGGGR